MFEIESFTARPDFAEDRIRLDAISPSGDTQSIFLTRRLGDRFMPLLVERVEQQVTPGVPKELALAMSQQELRIEREENPLAEVQPQDDSIPWLCLTIHINDEPDGVLMTFTNEAEHTAAMSLPGNSARGVLEVFLVTYQRMEWSLEVFPGWLIEGDAVPQGEKRLLN
jgi:hypothetical protein